MRNKREDQLRSMKGQKPHEEIHYEDTALLK
jgi:hypothetical protein